VLHASHASDFHPAGSELHVGDQVTVGHKALLHGCRIGNQCLIGMGTIVMDNAVIENQTMLGAGSLVPSGKILLSGFLYLGNPARQIRHLTDREKEYLIYAADYYPQLKQRHQVSVE
jgi:carbonic anhydrase/acetyltransferase-like protein (isoleucine patch superfamily)